MVSLRMTPSASRTAAARMSASESGSGISPRTVGSRKLATASTSIPRPARMRARSSGTSSWRCVIASARAAPASPSGSRHGRPQTERSTPRKTRRVGPVAAVRAIVILLRAESLSKKLTILDEAGTLRQAVVEHAGGRIRLMGEPVDTARARGPCSVLDRQDQCASEPKIARAFSNEQILKIAVIASRPARTVEEVVHDAAEAVARIGAEHPHGLGRIVQASPGHRRGLVGDHNLVEGLVALPQRLPVGALIATDRPDRHIGCGHGRPPIRERLRALLRRCGVNCQQLRYSIPRPTAEPAFRRDREVFHIFFRRGEALARARDAVRVVHEAKTKLRVRLDLEPRERLEKSVIRAVARDRPWINSIERLIPRARRFARSTIS